jgi:ammonia channel protein AmtB
MPMNLFLFYPTRVFLTYIGSSCAGLVLFLTLPGLGFFYTGMVPVRSVLPTVKQILTIAVTITLLWICFGYSLTFSPVGLYLV